MKRRIVQLIVAGLAGAALLLVLLIAVLHSDGLQQRLWVRVTRYIATSYGIDVTAERAALRLYPARLELRGVVVAADRGVFGRIERVEARWHWRQLLATPPRLELLRVQGPELDLSRLPTPDDSSTEVGLTPAEALVLAEIGQLVVEDGSSRGETPSVSWHVDEFSCTGQWLQGVVRAEMGAARIAMLRAGRVLEGGPLELALHTDAAGVVIDRLALAGDSTQLTLAEFRSSWDGRDLVARARFTGRLEPLIFFWDPATAAQLAVAGELELELAVVAEDGVFHAVAEHTGERLELAGWGIDDLRAEGGLAGVEVQLAGREWGRGELSLVPEEAVSVVLRLEQAPVSRLAQLAPPGLGLSPPHDLALSGEFEARLPLPFDLDAASGSARLQGSWANGHLELAVLGTANDLRVERAYLELAGGSATVEGRIADQRSLLLEAAVTVHDVPAVGAELQQWWPGFPSMEAAGGSLELVATISGELADPQLVGELWWLEPELLGARAARLHAQLSGTAEELDWSGELLLTPGNTVTASGTTVASSTATTAEWRAELGDLDAARSLAPALAELTLGGGVVAAGAVQWDGAVWNVDGRIDSTGLGAPPWWVDELALVFRASPGRLQVDELTALSFGAQIMGSASVPLADFELPVQLELLVDRLDPARLPVELPLEVAGSATASLRVAGSLVAPVVDGELQWTSDGSSAALSALSLQYSVEDGQVRVLAPAIVTPGGPLTVVATTSVADLPRPSWLWPDAATGALRVDLHGQQLRLSSLLVALGVVDTLELEMTSDVDLALRWSWRDPRQRWGELTLENVLVASEYEDLRAATPLRVSLVDGRLTVEPFTMDGKRSHVLLQGGVDLDGGDLQATVDLVLDPAVARLIPLPVPVQLRGPITLQGLLSGSASAPVGRLLVDHEGGAIVMRDPALEIRDLDLALDLEGGVLTVSRGEATVNRGTVHIGGGWDPATGQGLVFELEKVAFLLPYGIVSRWGGVLAVEPDPRQLLRVVGDLELEGGLWDRPFDYAGELFGSTVGVSLTDDPLREVGLDIEVRGRGGIQVDNNLGEFEVRWDLLHVGGTAAEPALQGQLEIKSGGVLNLAGKAVEVQRGIVDFSGEPGVAPRLEIIPVDDVMSYGEGGGGEFDATLLATKTLARNLGSALGFENETLRPAEIAIETETSTASRFAVGQRLSRNLALFITTDLSEVQDVQTLLQLWNLPGLKGLALQAFQETADDVSGAAVIERIRWGGSKPTDDSPRIYRVRMEGDWPISKRRLKKAAGVAKGKPYDPFLLFVAGLRMEQELATEGYFQPLVEVGVEGDESLPTLVFSCEPGPRRPLVFVGDRPSKSARRQVASVYQPPPLEDSAFAAMTQILRRYWASEGYPDAEVQVARVGEELRVECRRGEKRQLRGPVVDGLPAEAAARVRALLGSPAELAMIEDDPQRGEQIVKRALRESGFHDVTEVVIRFVDTGDEGSELRISAEPGEPERITEISLAGEDPLGVLDSDVLPVSRGMRLDRLVVDRAVFRIRREYRNEGYPDVRVETWLEETAPSAWTVWVELDPGVQRSVEAIEFKGLRHLKESVLRRGLTIADGDLLRIAEVDRSAVQIGGFAPVERIDVEVRPSSPGVSTVELTVSEKPRWTAGLGARYRSDRGLEAVVDLRDDNLLGRGLSLNLRGRWEKNEQQVSVLTALPRLPGGRWSTSAIFSYFEGPAKEDPEYSTEETLSGSLELSYELRRRTTLRSYFRWDDTTISDPFDPYGAQELEVSTLGAIFIHDRLDDPFDARSGYYAAADVGWSSSIWGSDLDTARTLLTGSLALAPRAGWTWAQTLRLGVAEALKGTVLDTTQKFFAGGQASIRGFERDSVGPLQPSGSGLVGAGGGALFVLNEELRIPIWNGLRLAVFADAGQVWEDWATVDAELSIGAGLGLRYSTPVGPLWVDIAWPVANRGISNGFKFYFGIGRPF